MIEEIRADIFRVEIPIPNNPLGATNSYVLRGKDRHLIIDTGLNGDEQMSVMASALKGLGVDPGDADIFLTHLHPDHIGLASRLSRHGGKIYFNRIEAEWMKESTGFPDLPDFAAANGFPAEEMGDVYATLHGLESNLDRGMVFHIVDEPDTLLVGEHELRCIATPGHSKGHLCLYAPQERILFAGDHLLKHITPALQAIGRDDWDPLKHYLESLEKTRRLDIDLVLPGHLQSFTDYKERIDELREHHFKRLDEVLEILRKGPMNAFQISSLMTWNIAYDSWEILPPFHKLIAIGEALAHIIYLVGLGKLTKVMDGKTAFYELS